MAHDQSGATDPNYLRELLLRCIDPDVQEAFHELEASRTPDEWVQREAMLPSALVKNLSGGAEPWVRGQGYVWPMFPGLYCPACRTSLPPAGLGTKGAHLQAHFAGSGPGGMCEVVREVLVLLRTRRADKFSDTAIERAMERYSVRGQLHKARRRTTGPAGMENPTG